MNRAVSQRLGSEILLPLLILLSAASGHSLTADRYQVVHVYHHDPGAFTQGLVYLHGILYESTGLNGRSTLRAVDLKTGAVLQRLNLPEKCFAEGLTAWHDTLIQLTWKAHTGFVYDPFSFSLLRTFHYDGEGWLTQDGKAAHSERWKLNPSGSRSPNIQGDTPCQSHRERESCR